MLHNNVIRTLILKIIVIRACSVVSTYLFVTGADMLAAIVLLQNPTLYKRSQHFLISVDVAQCPWASVDGDAPMDLSFLTS